MERQNVVDDDDTVEAPASAADDDTVEAPASAVDGDTVEARASAADDDTMEAPASAVDDDTVEAPAQRNGMETSVEADSGRSSVILSRKQDGKPYVREDFTDSLNEILECL